MTMEGLSQKATILERIAAGDQTAVEDCLQQYGGLVWSLANRLLANATDAEDVAQEVFVEIWKKAKSFDAAKSSESTFVTLIARRRIIDRRRRGSAAVDTQSMSTVAFEIPEHAPAEPAELADEANKALDCVRKLSADQQKVIQLSIHQGVSHRGIAERLSMPLGTVKSFARRALLQLRECMTHPVLATSDGGTS
ncbi:sigma-70 family RNA polymerase sigma factor [Novipirellula artificiosorum]|uniref:ECF RNA polymerase sigma factor SigK n=1 Tax=Novipirellula artificiosorum TaxID=2528016 RepID=A0A5C6DDE7_9BACT|nr:sigma-70 family RNA polymerase sigma factor [Novipirellula artificiosorum]TWU33904.1 ECF RNA polymerase sigma factor SigK [Novipirellula artificiosorum]